jgi:8-oxo-dGTP pyrophosphatase MutT (NUDIX family)
MITTAQIADVLDRYLNCYPDTYDSAYPLLRALLHCDDLTSRKTFPLHVTCSTAAVDDTGHVLVIKHQILGKWLFPGGHVDPDDTDLMGAALRELEEETGIGPESVLPLGSTPFEIDVHPIPASPRRGEPAHSHADLAWAFHVTGGALVTLQQGEVTDYAWVEPTSEELRRLAVNVA